ncbi:MAG TPA: long-chain-fatty-acid--CoA ligase [Pseudonocardiaceae bacterium]|jgi:acyl-CoA synthetase (AMP-forming)/AMP-acid ligase II|nr:long-chain-fatty-acid--CoA ligase [Pseudonocardiaceae bacterium]
MSAPAWDQNDAARGDLPGELPGGGVSWVDQVARHAHRIPDRVALRFESRSTTWTELDHRVRTLAAGLRDRGVAAGDRVAVLMTNRPEFIETVLAVNTLGGIAVPVNFRLSAAEIRYIIVDSGARLLVADSGLAPLAGAVRAESAQPPGCLVVGDSTGAAGPGAESYQDLLAGPVAEAPAAAISERDIALIMYTSGTTGRPKGAMLSHLNLMVQCLTVIQAFGQSTAEISLCASPMFHIAGIGLFAPVLLGGGTVVIMPSGQFDAGTTLDVLEREQVTTLFLVPAQWQVLCADPNVAGRASSLRTISWGAAPATVSLLETMARTFPEATNIALFGQTEMSPVTCALDGGDALRKIGSVGKPVPFVAARVVDDEMNDVPPGAVGEIVYRGPGTMAGYWNNPAATADAFAGGWFHSGDLVRVDDEGFVYVVDRKKDMIISGGENIYCAEVENVLAGHPGVADVAVIGGKDQRWGETPIAIIVPARPDEPPTLDDLTAWSRDRLASYKKPTAIVLIDALPRNASGKVLKHQLRATYGDR